jgi:hypothetical protein
MRRRGAEQPVDGRQLWIVAQATFCALLAVVKYGG